MATIGVNLESQELAQGHEPKVPTPVYEKNLEIGTVTAAHDSDELLREAPTDEELHTLRRVSGPIPWTAYTIAFVELCERFSYYGTTAVFVNFIQRDLPAGSTTGAGFDGQSGALGMGQRASTGITTFNSFWAYTMPLVGAYIADQYLGRLKTIQYSILIAIVGHVLLVISATPKVIVHSGGALACMIIGVIVMGVGTGGFKSNISPLIAEQYTETQMYITTTKKGERVIMDPTITISRIYLYFYMMINIGSLLGSIGMVYAEKYVGFWLSFTLPTLLFLCCPAVLFACRNKYNQAKPTGSALGKALKLWGLAMKGQWSINPAKTRKNMSDPQFWGRVKPSHLGANKPAWMTFDDTWVDEVRRGLLACRVFLFYPLYWLAYNQMTNNLTSQAATMTLNGAPNDLIGNLNPISIIIFIPIMDHIVYPGLRKMGIHFTPLKRIFCGFMLASAAMVSACVTQYYIYKTHPCGDHPNSCDEAHLEGPINVWVQTVPYALIGFSEIMASITSLEYAFTKAPKNMRSIVMSINLFMTAISSALAQALVSLSDDPLLVWNYGIVAVLAFVSGIWFWMNNRKLDAEEDKLNMLPDSDFSGKVREVERDAELRKASVASQGASQEKKSEL